MLSFKMSSDLKESIAHLMNFLHRLVTSMAKEGRIVQQDLDVFDFLIRSVVTELGPIHFSERILVRNAEEDFEVMPTPSHRNRSSGALCTPLQHILKLIL